MRLSQDIRYFSQFLQLIHLFQQIKYPHKKNIVEMKQLPCWFVKNNLEKNGYT